MKKLMLAMLSFVAFGSDLVLAHGGGHPTPPPTPPIVNPIPPPVTPPLTPVTPPAYIVVPVSSTTGNYVIYWGAVTGITSFELEEAHNHMFSAGFPTNLYPMSPTVTAVQLNSRPNGNWYYRVRSVNSGAYSTWCAASNPCAVLLQGTITLSIGPASPASTWPLAGGPAVSVMQISISADQVENVSVNSLTLRASGTLDDSADILGVDLYLDVNANGVLDPGLDLLLNGPAAFSANDGTLVMTTPGRTILAGTSEKWLIIAQVAPSAPVAGTFRIGISGPSDVSTTGNTTGLSARILGTPLISGALTVRNPATPTPPPPPVLTGSLKVSVPGTGPAKGDLPAGSKRSEVLHLLLEAGAGEAVRVDTLILSHFGTVREPCGKVAYSLWEDSNGDERFDPDRDCLVRGLVPVMPESAVILFPGLGLTVPAGSARLLVLAVDVSDDVKSGSTLGLNLTSASCVTATGASSQGSIPVEYSPVLGPEMTVIDPAPAPVAASGGCAAGSGADDSVASILSFALLLLAALVTTRAARIGM